ncbi:hypothetical protein L249_5845 [Ophiocordyceps polyrhachis-furcata BCC 54312]|uniref:Uncharacterized protein n=1 Tax=Ophiocordyceps polyrhachis-furcata BCC 54312 TaxID=1330021 RepID=A0A367L0I3_9HYPO|nr:hypothetical protein L249_5845 [Ophiocordyceps polyrhachis-furcata BCC 54312]
MSIWLLLLLDEGVVTDTFHPIPFYDLLFENPVKPRKLFSDTSTDLSYKRKDEFDSTRTGRIMRLALALIPHFQVSRG